MPNVGKSTLFNCLSNAKAQAANFPFCTIEPNLGVINVPDERLLKLEDLVKPNKVVPATVEIVDIAGLVKGASKGEGLGNQFLANIRETDAIIHVLRCFDDDCGRAQAPDGGADSRVGGGWDLNDRAGAHGPAVDRVTGREERRIIRRRDRLRNAHRRRQIRIPDRGNDRAVDTG